MASIDNIQSVADSVLANAVQEGQLIETDTSGVFSFNVNDVEVFTSSETNVELPEDGIAIILSGNENITATGNNNDNFVTGNEANNVIDGGGGDDQIDGGAGNDTMVDGDGNDTVAGGQGDDTIIVGNGDDNFNGGEGNDDFVINETEQGNNDLTGLNRGDKLLINDRNGDGNLDLQDVQNVEAGENGLTLTFVDGTSVTLEGVFSLEGINIEIDDDGGFAILS